jgi:hypothetical protein
VNLQQQYLARLLREHEERVRQWQTPPRRDLHPIADVIGAALLLAGYVIVVLWMLT